VRRLAEHEAEGTFEVAVHAEDGIVTRRIFPGTAESNADPRDIERYGEPMRTLLLFGAGHVGRALVLALSALPFRIIWVDARPDAFPGAVPANVTLVRPADPVAVLASAAAGGFVLIMTHSHELDLALCDAALRAERFPYVGVIGSETKAARFRRRLVEAGIAQASVDQLVCPIGALGPKSKLPAVIAAATVVELLVKDEMCLKVGAGMSADQALSTAGIAGVEAMARGQSSGR
jgi:xanthine dehydrogenase accessory factor